MSGFVIPWSDWLHAAAQLGVLPAQFWRLSVTEWLAIMRPPDARVFSQTDLARLMAAFPDFKIQNQESAGT